RTVREPLGSHGSHCPAVGAHAQTPVRKQPRLASSDARQPPSCPLAVAAQPVVLPFGPSNEILVDASEKWTQLGLVEASVVIDPPLHDGVHRSRKVVQRLVTPQIESPTPQLSTHCFESVVAHCL